MSGCCGKGASSQNGKKVNCGIVSTNTTNRCAPGANVDRNREKCVSGKHDEEVCHGTGERRRDLIDQLKIFLSDFDDKPCIVTPPQQGPNALRPLGSYDEYLKKHCHSWIPPNPRPPLITSVQTHEVRATSDYQKMKGENSETISFTDATLKPPVFACECVKRNGLQDQCSHPMCKPPTAQCLANNPGPCCPPSLGLGGPNDASGGSKREGTSGMSNQNYGQGRQDCSEYQAAYVHSPPDSHQPQSNNNYSHTPDYTTTYQQDYHQHHVHQNGGQQQQMMMNQATSGFQPTFGGPRHQDYQQQSINSGFPKLPPGMQMMCICKAPSSELPSGKKYLCCPGPR